MPEELFDVLDEHDRVLRRETRAEVHRQRLLHRAVHILLFNSRGEIYLQRRSAQKDTYPHRWTTSCCGHVDAGETYDTAAIRELAEELGLEGVALGENRTDGTKGTNATGVTKAIQAAKEAEATKGKKATTRKLQPAIVHPSSLIPHPSSVPHSPFHTSHSTLPPSSLLLHPFLKHPPCRDTGWEFIWIYTLTTDAPPAPDPAEISEGRWLTPADLDAWMKSEPKAFTPSFTLVWKLWRKK
jgi:isopentenyldiphosphate isomerase